MQLLDPLYDQLPGYPCAWSPCESYRYTLWRVWGPNPSKIFMCVGLNPSTADEVQNDPTIRRVISFAQREGCDALLMANAFAFRAKDPDDMKSSADPIGPENDKWLQECSKMASIVVAAWGVHGGFMKRNDTIRKLLPNLMCFGKTKHGHPKHPLYLAADTPLQSF